MIFCCFLAFTHHLCCSLLVPTCSPFPLLLLTIAAPTPTPSFQQFDCDMPVYACVCVYLSCWGHWASGSLCWSPLSVLESFCPLSLYILLSHLLFCWLSALWTAWMFSLPFSPISGFLHLISLPYTQNALEVFISCFLVLSPTFRGQLPWTHWMPICFIEILCFPVLPLDFCTQWRSMRKNWQVGLVIRPTVNCNPLSESTCSH